MRKKIMDLFIKLCGSYTESDNDQWQSIKIDKKNPIVEITNVYTNLGSTTDLDRDTNPDIPWAENHFRERINGKPINPGEEYKNWPYYKKSQEFNDKEFRDKGKFSHNYMERYWCSDLKGRRYCYGDLRDIINRLKKNPNTRQAYLSVWHPEDQSNGERRRVPCTLGYWFYKEKGKINCTYHIRSCDAIRHLDNDIYMTYRLLQYVCSEIKEEPGELIMWIGSLHCFKSDLYYLNCIIKKYVWDSNK